MRWETRIFANFRTVFSLSAIVRRRCFNETAILTHSNHCNYQTRRFTNRKTKPFQNVGCCMRKKKESKALFYINFSFVIVSRLLKAVRFRIEMVVLLQFHVYFNQQTYFPHIFSTIEQLPLQFHAGEFPWQWPATRKMACIQLQNKNGNEQPTNESSTEFDKFRLGLFIIIHEK